MSEQCLVLVFLFISSVFLLSCVQLNLTVVLCLMTTFPFQCRDEQSDRHRFWLKFSFPEAHS